MFGSACGGFGIDCGVVTALPRSTPSAAAAPSPPVFGLASEPRRPIRALPALLVNQIAAGEVIERPASVLKELVENSLDAGASRVRVDLEAGGVELLRVTDDGCGVPADELPLALHPHATSKLRDAEDLDRISTLGFRGEALASIASVSRLTMRSRPHGAATAHGLRVEGGHVTQGVQPAAGPVGTCVEVRQLFFNTPARRKFLRTEATERGRCMDWLSDLAMAHPAVGFTLTADGRTLLDLPAGQSPRARAVALLGEELDGELLEVHADHLDDTRGLAMWGLIGKPAIARPTNKHQHTFLNGRVIRDKTVQHALKEAYRGLLDHTRHPTAVLMLEMTPAAVDVNVHPAKLEVRFRDGSAVHSAVLRAVREALRAADLTADFLAPPGAPPAFGPGDTGRDPAAFARRVQDVREEAARAAAAASALRAEEGAGPPRLPFPPVAQVRAAVAPAGAEADGLGGVGRAARFVQVHDSYIVAEDEQGLVIIDQHALHERVMFETLLARVRASGADGLERQRLLTPELAEATAGQVMLLEGVRPLLARLGVDAAAFGPRTVAVHAGPTLLAERGVGLAAFVVEVLAKVERGEIRVEDAAEGAGGARTNADESALHAVLDMMACKSAVKAGDRLSDGEIAELLSLRERVERSAACPHGRPTSVRVGLSQLERLFHRR